MKGRGQHQCTFPAMLAILILSVLVTPVLADKAGQSDKLQQLDNSITRVEGEIAEVSRTHSKVRKQLKHWEVQIARVSKQLRELNQKEASLAASLQQHNQQYRTLEASLDQHRDLLAAQLQAAYVNGKQEYLKLLFNQEDPATMGRMLAYYEYYSNARLQKIHRINEDLRKVGEIKEQITLESRQLAALREDYKSRQQELLASTRERKNVLESLTSEIQSKNLALNRLREEKKDLEALIQSLQSRSSADKVPDSIKRQAFLPRRGHLGWPTRGKLSKRYGSRQVGNLKLQGIIIDAGASEEVYAVSHGRVVFADWLPGYGMVIIIDHGKNYISLYGYNQSLLKEKGDWVDTGDVLATVGNSGGRKQTGLYFEIRHQGRPQNPLVWLNPKSSILAAAKP